VGHDANVGQHSNDIVQARAAITCVNDLSRRPQQVTVGEEPEGALLPLTHLPQRRLEVSRYDYAGKQPIQDVTDGLGRGWHKGIERTLHVLGFARPLLAPLQLLSFQEHNRLSSRRCQQGQ
jgi:hypothetical protein